MATSLPHGKSHVKRNLPNGIWHERQRSSKGVGNVVIKRAREARGWTQEQLAERIGLSISQISRFESGARGLPRVNEIVAIAKTLGIPLLELMEPYVSVGDEGLLINPDPKIIFAHRHNFT